MTTKVTTRRERAKALQVAIREYDYAYYVECKPLIPDSRYDALFKELVELENGFPDLKTPDSPTQRVGGLVPKGATVKHAVPMLSIAYSTSTEIVFDFCKRMQERIGPEVRFVVEDKVDGLALELLYRDGLLCSACTRGDGDTGQNVMTAVRKIGDIPVGCATHMSLDDIAGEVVVRGEVYVRNADFRQLARNYEAAGKELSTTPRNIAAGELLRTAGSKSEGYKLPLHFIAHGFGPRPSVSCMAETTTHMEVMQAIYSAFSILHLPAAGGLAIDEVGGKLEEFSDQTRVSGLPYPVDGIVVKVDGLTHRQKVNDAKNKRDYPWAYAYKWQQFTAQTTVRRFDTQVGKHGTLTPVVYFDPCIIDGTTVTKATLHNFDQVKKMPGPTRKAVGVQKGDVILVEKAGKIIPHVLKVVKPVPGKRTPYAPPKKCPSCGGHVEKEGPMIRCANARERCPVQLQAALIAALDRDRLDVDGFGPKLAKLLTTPQKKGDKPLVYNLADLYALESRRSELEALPGVGAGTINKLFRGLSEAKERPSHRLLAAFGIPGCGRTASKALIDHFGSISAVARASRAALLLVEGIGPESASSIRIWFLEPKNKLLVAALRLQGLNFGDRDAAPTPVGDALSGKKICVTGKLEHYTRDSIQQLIVESGGVVAKSVSKNVDYLVAGADAGSKLAKAQQCGVKVISEQEFRELL